MNKGLVLIISGPSGAGKGSVIKPYLKRNPKCNYSISITTRNPRKEDTDGITYHFRPKETVKEMIDAGKFLEWDTYCGNYYGTPLDFVMDSVNGGKDCILELTVPGALNVKEKLPESVMIFVAPPDMEELRRRITSRGSEEINAIESRMNKAIWELKMMENYDYVIINGDINAAIEDLESIAAAEKLKFNRCINKLNKLGLLQEEK